MSSKKGDILNNACKCQHKENRCLMLLSTQRVNIYTTICTSSWFTLS